MSSGCQTTGFFLEEIIISTHTQLHKFWSKLECTEMKCDKILLHVGHLFVFSVVVQVRSSPSQNSLEHPGIYFDEVPSISQL